MVCLPSVGLDGFEFIEGWFKDYFSLFKVGVGFI